MAFVCDLKSQDHQKPADDGEDLEDGEIEDDDDNDMPPADVPQCDADGPTLPAIVAAAVVTEAVTHKSSEKSSKDARKERKSSRHEKKHMTEAEKSVLYLHKMERLEREKRDKYRREQVHSRRRGGSISPTPPDIHASTNNNQEHNANSDDAADEDFATSLQRVLQSVLKKDKSAQAQAAVAAVNQQGAVSTSTTGNTAATPTIADSACAELGAGGTGSTLGDEGDGSAETTKRVARRRKRERKKAVKRARLEAVLTAALSSDGPQLEVNDSNESTNINGGSPSHANNRKMDTQDDIMNASDYSISSDDEHDRHDRKNRERRCNRRMKRRYRSVDRDSGMGGTPTKVKKGETKLGLCLSYIQGKCMNRDCPYSHEYSPHMKMELCKFYLMECCAKGDKCYYLHSEFPCKYYHTGLPCIDGDKCKFNHGKPLSDSFRSILCKHIETAPKEILGDFPRFNREDAMNMIAITQKKLEEKYSEKKEMKDNDKNDDKRDAKRNRPSRWQDKTHDQMGSVVNLNFLHDKDQDMRFTSNNGDIDMRTLPSTPNNQPPHNIPLPITINTSTPPPNINLNQNIHHQPQPSPPMPHKNPSLNPPTTISNNNTANASASGQNNPSAALLQQLGVSNPAAAALLLAGAQSGPARVAAVAALLQGAVRSQQVQMLAGAPIVAGNANVGALNQPPPIPITMQIPPPQLNTNAILFSTPPPSILSTPPPIIRPPHLNQPPIHQQNVASVINPTRNTSTTSMMDQHHHHHHPIVTNPPPTSTIVADLKMDVVMDNIQELVQKNSSKQMRENIVKKDIMDIKLEVGGVSDDGVLDIERYKREAGIGRKDVKQESIQQVKREIEEEEDESGSLKIDYDPPLEAVKNEQDVEVQSLKPELPNLPRAQMDLFLRIQSQQAKSDKTPSATNTNEQSTITTIISDTSSNMDISTSSQNTTTKDNTGTTSNDIDPTSSIDWYSDDDDDDDDDDNKLTIGEDAEYDDIITKSVNEVPKSSEDSKKVQEEVVVLLPPVVEDVPPAAQIVEKLGDLSKIDISAEVTKLLTSIGSGGKKKEEKSSPSSTNKPSSSYTPPSDPRTGSKSPRSSTDPRLTSDHSHHHHHHRHHHHRSNDRAPSTSPKTASSSPSHNSASSSSGRADPRRRRSSAESSDSGKSSGSGRAPVPSIYDQATASFRMSNKDLDLRLGGSVTVVDSDLRTKLADVDLRSVSQGGRPDIDLRATMPQQLSLPLQFKAAIAGYTPATEIDATYHASYVWRIYEVDVPRPDYSGLRLTEAEARSTGDPRLEKIFRLAVGSSAGDLNIDENKEKTEFTIDESPASPVRDSPAAAKPTTPRADPRRRKPIEEPPTNNDPTQLTYAQQLSLLQTSNFYQNLTSNQKLNLNHELSIRMQQQQQQQHQQQQLPPNAHPQQHHHQQQLQQPNTNTNDPVMGAVLHSLGLTGGNSLQQQQHQQQQMMVQLQQYGAIGLMQQLGVGGGQRIGGGGPGGGGGGGPPSGQQGLLGAAPGVPHDFGGPIQPPFVGGPPNLPPIRNNNNPSGNFNNSPNDNYDQYEDDDSYNNCYNNNNHNSNMMMGGGGSRNNHRGGNNSGGGGFRDNRNNRRGGGGGTQGQNRNFGRNNRNNFRSRNRNNNMGNNQNRGGMVD